MNKKKHSNYTGGFTLIELLVVVTILGILMSLAVNCAGAIGSQAPDGMLQKPLDLQVQHSLAVYAVLDKRIMYKRWRWL